MNPDKKHVDPVDVQYEQQQDFTDFMREQQQKPPRDPYEYSDRYDHHDYE